MATAGELTKVIATALDLDLRLVTQVFRSLREAGLLTKGGRGNSAPAMTPLDAARVLIALLVTDRPVDASSVVQEVGQFQLSPYSVQQDDFSFKAGDRFENNFAALIAKLGSLPDAAINRFDGYIQAKFPDLFIGIELYAFGKSYMYVHPSWFAQLSPEKPIVFLKSDARALAPSQAFALSKRLAPSKIKMTRRIDEIALAVAALKIREM